MAYTLVVVESPSKAKTINKYLGSNYKVIASYGHVRDLPSKNGSVEPDNNFAMIWQLDDQGKRRVQDIAKLAKDADKLYLATDPDREGEAISWHIREVLSEKKTYQNLPMQRIVFNEITKKAVQDAVQKPREINSGLVDAYLARRALDYLVGFNLSPILWRKLPGSRSAGRVQSVALRLIVEREQEIEVFNAQEYWSVETLCLPKAKSKFKAKLTHLDAKKLTKFSLGNEKSALDAVQAIDRAKFTVGKVEKKQVKRNPTAPFTTSTLQQEAARKLYFSPKSTMIVAQKLYEGVDISGETIGLITYMRTDSVNLSQEAITGARNFIESDYGKKYLPSAPRIYKSKAKNAQEAHEAIRPTDVRRTPNEMRKYLDDQQFKLYELVWNRTVASQMESALFDQVGVDILSTDKNTILRATGSTLVFDGFLKLYQEGEDDKQQEDESALLPPLIEGEVIDIEKITPNQHFTQPPPRYSEASLVKKLEELGIGRPSTFVSLLQTLQDRKYVKLEKKQFHPEQRGRIVTSFLLHYFAKYLQYDFTASLEEELDEISDGSKSWLDVMNKFWKPFEGTVKQAEPLKITDVLTALQNDLEPMLFDMSKENPKQCPKCMIGSMHLKLSKFGPFLGCDRYPDCAFTKALDKSEEGEELHELGDIITLGHDPKLGVDVTVRKGPYGPYFQWEQKDEKKPKRVSLPAGLSMQSATLQDALELGRLPFELCKHPESGDEILVNVGRFGPYLKYQSMFVSIPKSITFMDVTPEQAFELIEKKKNAPPRKFGKKVVAKADTKTKKTPVKKTAAKKTVTKKKS